MAAVSTVGRQAIRRFAEHEHEELAAGIDRIHELGEEMAQLPVDRRAAGIRWVLHWIDADLKPHMAWEESWLFPQIDVRARTPWATRVIRFDHQQIAAQAERLHAHAEGGGHLPSHDTVTWSPTCPAWRRSCAPTSSARNASCSHCSNRRPKGGNHSGATDHRGATDRRITVRASSSGRPRSPARSIIGGSLPTRTYPMALARRSSSWRFDRRRRCGTTIPRLSTTG